jgi:hypothetical protein
MRIFLSCLQSDARHDVPAYGFWESYFKNGLEETGHEWIEAKDVDWAQGLAAGGNGELDAWRDRAWSKTLAHIKTVQQEKSPVNYGGLRVQPRLIWIGKPLINLFDGLLL